MDKQTIPQVFGMIPIKNRRSYPKTIFFEIKSKKERPTGICNIAAIPTGRFFNILSAT